MGLLGDAGFSSSPMSGGGTGLALVGAYLLAGELAAAGWDPKAGFRRAVQPQAGLGGGAKGSPTRTR